MAIPLPFPDYPFVHTVYDFYIPIMCLYYVLKGLPQITLVNMIQLTELLSDWPLSLLLFPNKHKTPHSSHFFWLK